MKNSPLDSASVIRGRIPSASKRPSRLKGLRWKRRQFCRGWLITGDTGSGKTTSGINQLAHQVFRNEPRWGGLCIDEKGVYWETLRAMAARYGRKHDLLQIQVRPDDAPAAWTPEHRFNLTGNREMPFTTYAKFVVDTATSLGQWGDKGFFKSQAQTHIAHALELLFESRQPVTLAGAFELLSQRDKLEQEIESLRELHPAPRRVAVIKHFTNPFLTQPDEQLGGVRETIGNYLQYFLTLEVAEVFCSRDSTFDIADVDSGKILCVTMPQRFQTERRYVNTLLKLLLYNHTLHEAKTDTANSEKLTLTKLREALGWSRNQFSHVMNASDRAIVNWEQGDSISPVYAAKLREIQSVYNELKQLMKPEEIGPWLLTEMEEFEGHTPVDLISKGETGRLWASVFCLRSGVPDQSAIGKRDDNYSEAEEHTHRFELRLARRSPWSRRYHWGSPLCASRCSGQFLQE